ncbi:MAG TPA: CBS domain-containing protein [Verrucomicrobiales bacterium]|jgi:CBS domain-containing protein|nr:CBS domain-containing protein [Verrucomicrobiales bacterium]
MNVNQIMTADVAVVRPETTLQEAAQQMRTLGIGCLPVCDGDRLVGMLTDRDIALRAVAEGLTPAETAVSRCMTPEVRWCYEDQSIEEAQQMMKKRQVRRLPVISREKRLVGILTLGDLAIKTDATTEVGETVREISELAPA